MRVILATVTSCAIALSLTACSSEPEIDPLAVVSSATITDIEDNTGSDFYTVRTAELEQTGLGTELTLGFAISNTNGIKFSPVSTITFSDGSVISCEADDLRRVPSLVESTDTWDFACDGNLPQDADGATISIVDDYN